MEIPSDGGPYHPQPQATTDAWCATHWQMIGGVSLRIRLAMQFAAAWLPIYCTCDSSISNDDAIAKANELGLAQADDLLKRLKEGT